MIANCLSIPLVNGGAIEVDTDVDICDVEGGDDRDQRQQSKTHKLPEVTTYNDKQYDIAFIKAGANYGNISRALDIVRDFIVAKNRIIYGGMSIDISLRAAGEAGIYPPDEVPDYDFMSPDFYADSIELAGILHAAGFAEVNSINGTHVSTRRVRLGSDSVADITYTPPAIYAAMPTVTHDGFRVVHPDFQRMDMHRALSLLLEKPPREVIQQRAAKDYKRYQLLDGAYPIVEPLSKDKGNGKIVTRTFALPAGDDYVIGGFAAMAELLVEGSLTRSGTTLSVRAPESYGDWPLCLYTDRPYAVARELKLDGVTYYSRYLDSYHPRAICGSIKAGADVVAYEIYDNLGTLIPTWKSKEKDAPRLCTVHLTALYMLLRSFSPPILGPAKPADAAARSLRYRGYYAVLADMLRAYCCKTESAPSSRGFALSLDMYGAQNWPLEYLQTMSVNAEHIAATPDYSEIDKNSMGTNEPLNRPTVKLGWYPDRGMPAEVIARASELFLMTDGAERPAFTAILPLDK